MSLKRPCARRTPPPLLSGHRFQDAIRFDAFLKENDKLAHQALKDAEREAKAKTDKLYEIKKLKHAISLLEGENSKMKDALEECDRYRRVS